MRAMMINKYGKNEQLHMKEIDQPEVGVHDVLVEIHAASVNPIDFKIRNGGALKLILKYDMPLTLGNDFSGVVVEVGSNVTKFKVGDEVYGRPSKDRIGTFAEMIAIHEDELAKKPNTLSFEEAASLPLVGLTTWQAFHEKFNLKAGQKILIHAGSGGVGTFAIQLAKAMGAYVATTVSDQGYELVKSLGADEIINYRKKNFEEELSGYDAVFDTLGGESLERSFKVLKPGGKIVSVSAVPTKTLAEEMGLGPLKKILFSVISRKLMIMAKKHDAEYDFLLMRPSGEQLDKIKELVESGKIKPIIDKIYALEEAQGAMAYNETGRAKGKVIVKVK
ncbi:NADP-dependent oxidoreductase [Pseudalkalibacillus berkeleyi]|uniref:NADP-dependent oxidoreductase n=1 Tax=Pseudalkalibacillus berkeleyi TaxID=1069813 RepID=A0ABS9GYF1_9BACL|nr:NADP-dependent oxidoreductase [Pseudalkalibacillus berkeleyi]MCF6136405.1 NADP-dependent oxidoreductase [Pseudalkalibacillus berkeleyi]